LCRTYWYPLYTFVRRQGHDPHCAQDLTQEFFARLLTKDYLAGVKREKGRFRSFLLATLKHFLADEWDRSRRIKRGGGKTPISLDDTTAEARYGLEPSHDLSPDRMYERRWATTLLEQVLSRLETQFTAAGNGPLFDALQEYLAKEAKATPYAETAAKLGMTEGAVRVAVHRLRQRYREILRAEIAHTVADPAQIDDELRHLFCALSS
jgi:RNA polymerase sigma-70 factor (ECF subfamily)